MKNHMLHSPSTYQQHLGRSVDVKSKILSMLVLSILVLFTITFEQLVVFYLLAGLLGVVYKTNVKGVMTKSLISLPLVFSLSLLAFFSQTGGSSLTFANFSVFYSPIELAVFYFLRSELLVVIALEVIESEESFFDIVFGLSELGLPTFLTNVLLFMYRTILDLQLESSRMIDARQVRSHGQKLGASIFSYRVIGYMVGAVFIRGLQHSSQRRDALVSRGFDGHLPVRGIRFTARGATVLWISSIIGLLTLLGAGLRFHNLVR